VALATAGLAAVAGSVWAAREYGGGAFWPGLVGNFGASLLAFMLALWWERSRERRQEAKDARTAAAEREGEAADLQARRETEARRRLEPVREELRRNRASLEMLSNAYAQPPDSGSYRVLHPELLGGAWEANAPRLAELLADYALTSDLASTHGRIEELRWRLRQRTATMSAMAGSAIAQNLAASLEAITVPLVSELLGEVDGLLERVGQQIAAPDVQRLGLVHVDSGTVTVPMTASGVEG
jgi:hypothetical protein